jgi:hypothetical protein
VHGMDFEHRGHRLVREAPHASEVAAAPRSRVRVLSRALT